MYTFLSFEVFPWNLLHACSYLVYSWRIHHVFGRIESFDHVFEALNLIEYMHVMFVLCSWSLFENCVQLAYFWAWFYKIDLQNMLYYGFKVFFQKMGPKGWVLVSWMLGLSFEGKSGKPRIWLPHSSEGFHAQASTFVF